MAIPCWRADVSHENHASIDGLLEEVAAHLDPARCSIHFARVGDVGIGYENNLLHTQQLSADFFRWHRRSLELGMTVSKPGARRPCQTCSFEDGVYGAVVNADGTLASCWETAGKPGWEVGTAAQGYLPRGQTSPRWISCEDNYRFSEDGRTLASFRDSLDAALLDYLDETGRL